MTFGHAFATCHNHPHCVFCSNFIKLREILAPTNFFDKSGTLCSHTRRLVPGPETCSSQLWQVLDTHRSVGVSASLRACIYSAGTPGTSSRAADRQQDRFQIWGLITLDRLLPTPDQSLTKAWTFIMPGPALQDLTNKQSETVADSKGKLLFLGGTKAVGDKTAFLYKSLAARSVGRHLGQQLLALDQPLQDSQLHDASLVVLICTDSLVPKKTLRAIHHAVKQGPCSLLVLLGCCKAAARQRINLLLDKFQMEADGAAVISSSPQRYLHPQEVLLIDCILNRRLQQRVSQVTSQPVSYFLSSVPLHVQTGLEGEGHLGWGLHNT